MLRLLILITTIFISLEGFEQQVIIYDTSSVPERKFSATALRQFKSDPVFQYNKVNEPSSSLWETFWTWFWGKVNSVMGTRAGQTAFKAVIIILAVGILVFFVLKLTGMSNSGLFGRNNIEDKLGYTVMEDNIHSINFETAIERAVLDNNLRFAVRLLYLHTLKNLADTGSINWQLNKTNVAYIGELNGKEYQQSFSKLTQQFENNWYGDLPIETNEFNIVRDQFNQFNKNLS